MNAHFNLDNFVKNPFNKDSFKGFLIELFAEKITFMDEIAYPQESCIIESLQIAKNVKLEGKELGIFIFQTKSVKAKITLHNELKKILKESTASAILAIFYEKEMKEFRLSLITSGFDYEKNKETFSDLKRGSFVLGHSQTATARNALQKLIDNKEALNLEVLKEAFSQEPVQEEFFKGYKKFFDTIIDKLEKANLNNYFKNYKGINHTKKAIKAFANKLLGRIVFLYFLQKKGWLGVPKDSEYGSGRQDFLKNIFEKTCKQKENFYDKYLRPLFFESLNKQRSDDFNPLFESKIPFLNGGLFEDELKDDKAHFAISQVLDNAFFKELFKFFESYNFTLEESSPKEVEIAIDPEMLGKIFENLIDYNKENGAFYTPREIVHYMCQNALLLHFKNSFPHNENELKALIFKQESDNDFVRKNAAKIQEKLLNLSILDPSLGSGAFPMGLLSEMISILESLNKTLESKDKADLKRRIISKCIYGIDIDADAIEIAKLRFWLSIAVDEQTPQPLPNLDFKFMQGNSLCDKICGREIIPNLNAAEPKAELNLFGYYDTKELDKISLFDSTKTDELKGLFGDYFSQNEAVKKEKAKKDILDLMEKVFNARIKELDKRIADLKNSISGVGLQASTKSKQQKQKDLKDYEDYENFKYELLALLDDYKKNDFHSDKVFLYHFFFADIMQSGGFDIIIGNPPYIQLQKNKGELAKLYEKQNFKSLAKTGDIYQLFYEKCFNLLSPNGVVSLITSNKWMRAGYGSLTRKYFYDKANVFKLVDLGAGVFATATVDTNIIFYGRLFESARERLIPAYTSLQDAKNDKINPHEVPQNLAPLRGAEKSDYINENTSIESRRIENAESHKDSAESNAESPSPSLRGRSPKQSICDSTENDFKDSIDYHKSQSDSHNDDIKALSTHYAKKTINAFEDKEWVIMDENERRIYEKISQHKPLKDWDIKIYRGVTTGFNEAFIIDEETRNRLIKEDKKSAELIKPILRGRDIKRYSYKFANLYLIFIPHHFPNTENPKSMKENEKDFQKLYPAIYNHLLQYKDKLLNRSGGGTRYEWYSLQAWAANSYKDFDKEKIAWQRITDKNKFVFSEKGQYISDSMAFISELKSKEQAYYILAVLNSNLVYFWVKHNVHEYGDTGFRLSNQYVEKIPIPKPDKKTQSDLVALVDKIIDGKKKGADTSEFEREIDLAVYRLYGLSAEEIRIVEGK